MSRKLRINRLAYLGAALGIVLAAALLLVWSGDRHGLAAIVILGTVLALSGLGLHWRKQASRQRHREAARRFRI